MARIRSANIDDVRQLLNCEKAVWESLRGVFTG